MPGRSLRSIADYLKFFEFELSDRKFTYIATLAGSALLALAGFAFPKTTEWGEYAWLALPVLILSWSLKILSAFRPGVIRSRFELKKAFDLDEAIKRSQPNDADAANGWRLNEATKMVQGSIQTSPEFNTRCMLDPNWDVPLEETDGNYRNIIHEIRKNRDPFKQHAIRTVLRKLAGPLALTNERKIGIASDFHATMTSVKLFESNYFATLCSGDLAHRDIIEVHANGKRDYSPARDRVPFAGPMDRLVLDRLSTASDRISTQIGINLLGITSDNVLLIAIQGEHNLHGAGARVPLTTGSMDWEDRLKSRTFKQLGEVAAIRELREEWGNNAALRRKKPLGFERFVPVGVFRVPGRAGKPEFAAIGRLNWKEADLRADMSEVDAWEDRAGTDRASHRYKVESFSDFTHAIRELREGTGREEDTAPLFGVLCCIQDAIDRNPDLLRSQLGYAS